MSREAAFAQMSEQDQAYCRKHFPPGDCKLCGAHMAYTERSYERAGVCCVCADKVLNLYWKEHSGEYLTWPNPPSAPDPKKKKKIPNALRLRVYERDKFKCVYCGSRKDLTLDHVTAESQGGDTAIGNLVTACKHCNCSKKTKTLAEFWEARS